MTTPSRTPSLSPGRCCSTSGRKPAPPAGPFAREQPDDFRAYRIDVDAHPGLADRFDIMSIPTLILLHDGQEILRLDGLIRDTDLTQLLTSPTNAIEGLQPPPLYPTR